MNHIEVFMAFFRININNLLLMIKILQNVSLSELTFYGIGGIANEVFEVYDVCDLAEIWKETLTQKIPRIILGKGANLVFSDKGFRGRVFLPKFEKIVWKENVVFVDAGIPFQDFIEASNKKGFSDLCELSGIPGSLGGFIRGNAGALGKEVSDFVVGVEYLDQNGDLKKIMKKDCEFQYRDSFFKKNPDSFVVRGIFELKKVSIPMEALKKTREILASRWQKNPAGKSGGCVFKNPKLNDKIVSAGSLLDGLGAKNDQIGNAKVSDKHANFLINLGNATQKDLVDLMQKWRGKVFEKYGVKLIPEIFICDEFGKKINL